MHVRLDDLALYLRGGLPEAETAEIDSHVAGCPACSEKLGEARCFLDQLGDLSQRQMASPSPQERRKAPRVPTNDPARIKLLHPAISEPLQGQILDASRDGMKLELPCALQPGTIVEIIFKRFIAIGEVRYSVRAGEVFHAGVLIQDVFPKS